MTPRAYTPRAELRDVTLRDGLQLTAKSLPTDRKVQIIRELLATRRADAGNRFDGAARPRSPTCGYARGRRRARTRGARTLLDLGGDTAACREGGRRRCAQLPILLLCFGFPQQGQHRANHRGQRGGDARCRADQPRSRRRDSAVHRHRVHVPLRGADRSGAGDRHRRRPTHRGSRRHRRMRHDRPGNTNAGQRPDTAASGNEPRSAASSSMGTTPGDLAWPTRSPRSTQAPRWWTDHLAALAAAHSPPAPAATLLPRTCCSPLDRTGSRRPRWRRWWRSPTSSSRNWVSRTAPDPPRARGPNQRRSSGSSATAVIGRAVTGDPAFLVTYPIPEPGLSSLRAAGRVHVPAAPPTPEELGEACSSGEFDVVVAQLSDRFDAHLLAQAKLAGISNYAVGYDNIDVPAATSNGIVVGNTPGVLTDATADLAMLLILATARRAIEADQFTRSGQFTGWKPDLLLGQDVSGATLGLAGFGRIARATAHRAAAFGMSITFCSHPPAGRLVDEAELAALPYPVAPGQLDRTRRNAVTFSLCTYRWPPPPGT